LTTEISLIQQMSPANLLIKNNIGDTCACC